MEKDSLVKSTSKKSAAAGKKKLTTKELLLKKFDEWKPDELFRPAAAVRSSTGFTAPPLVSSGDKAEVSRIRKLLFKTFDLSEPEADAPPPPISSPPVMEKRSDPMATIIKFALLGFALLVALVVKVSVSNRANYYIEPAKTGVEIRQGIFAPIGQERFIILKDAQAPESLQAVYSKNEVYTFVFNHYVKNADELLENPEMPDFERIKAYLNKAVPYAVTKKHHKLVTSRLNNIDQMILLIKADVAASKETIEDDEAALEYLKQAEALDVDGSKAALIKEKVAAVESSKAGLEQKIEQEQKTVEEATPPAK